MVRYAAPPPIKMPFDIRLMNGVSAVVFVIAAVTLASVAVSWLTRAPLFAIRVIQVEGDMARNSVATIRANAAPRLAGGFFSVNLMAARTAFESVPWVRQAVVRRVFPDRLVVQLQEHRAAALWDGEDRGDRLVNTFGEVFAANVGDVEEDGLPSFAGPAGSSAVMLSMQRRLAPVFERLSVEVQTLRLSGRGSWRVELDNGAVVELGRGTEEEVLARCEKFARTLPEITGRYQQPLEYADLRHIDGYAVRLRGVTTPTANANKTN